MCYMEGDQKQGERNARKFAMRVGGGAGSVCMHV